MSSASDANSGAHEADAKMRSVSFGVEPRPKPEPVARKGRPPGHRFHAEVDLGELDDRGRPSLPCAAHTVELSTSHILLLSRRMTYVGRRIAIAVHLVDAVPTPLYGEVFSCEYEGDGKYRIDVDLKKMPDVPALREWFADRVRT